MKEKLSIVFYLCASLIIFLLLYTFLHEFGHALVGVASGGKITAFKLGIGAYVRIEGASYNSFSLPFMNAFGAVFPYLCILIAISFYHKIAVNNFMQMLLFLVSISISFSLLPWVVIPFLYPKGKAPLNDDVTKFMMNSHLSPWVVSLTAIVLISFLLFITIKVKKAHIGYIKVLQKLRD